MKTKIKIGSLIMFTLTPIIVTTVPIKANNENRHKTNLNIYESKANPYEIVRSNFNRSYQEKAVNYLRDWIMNIDQEAFKKHQDTQVVAEVAQNITDFKSLTQELATSWSTGRWREQITDVLFRNKTEITKIKAIPDSQTGEIKVHFTLRTKLTFLDQDVVWVLKGKPDKEVGNSNQQLNIQKINERLKNAKVINQETKKIHLLAEKVKNIESLKEITGVDLNNLNLIKGSTIEQISATSNESGQLSIHIKMKTKYAEKQETIVTKITTGKSDSQVEQEIADLNQISDNTTLRNALQNLEVLNQGNEKVSQIAARIHDIDSLKKYTGVNLSKINLKGSKITDAIITAQATSDGRLTVNVHTKTMHATKPQADTSNFTLGKSDFQVDQDIANLNQISDNTTLRNALQNLEVLNQGNEKVSQIAARIHDIDSLKKYTGVNLSKINLKGSKITDAIIAAQATSDGRLTVNVRTTTMHATKPQADISNFTLGKSDFQVDQDIANLNQIKDRESIESKLLNIKILSYGNRDIKAIAKDINSIATLKEETGVDLAKVLLMGSTIKGISAYVDSKGKLIIKVILETKNASQPEKRLSQTVQHSPQVPSVINNTKTISTTSQEISKPSNNNRLFKISMIAGLSILGFLVLVFTIFIINSIHHRNKKSENENSN
ncbi:MAG: hypothetical protein HRT98_00195 [Mycoplasmatales bacterium]|nr:hypothetical protein [Mycoplasmatales bacterium]